MIYEETQATSIMLANLVTVETLVLRVEIEPIYGPNEEVGRCLHAWHREAGSHKQKVPFND